MSDPNGGAAALSHAHVFLGAGHEQVERKTWAANWLCETMMVAEIVGGLMFGSIALVADGLHMSTHAGALLLLAALAYIYARRHADDPNFTFGAGKLGDLGGFASASVGAPQDRGEGRGRLAWVARRRRMSVSVVGRTGGLAGIGRTF